MADEQPIINQPTINSIKPRRGLLKLTLISIGVIIGLFLLFLFLPNILGLFSKDIAPIDDSDLLVNINAKTSLVLSEENAYYGLESLIKEIVIKGYDWKVFQSYLDGSTWDEKNIKQLLIENKQILEYIDAAAEKPKFQIMVGVQPAPFLHNMELAELNILYLSKSGKDKEAFEEAFKILNIGQKLGASSEIQSHSLVLNYILSQAVEIIALENMQRLINESKNLSSNDFETYVSKLDDFSLNPETMDKYLKYLYTEESIAIDAITNGDIETLEKLDVSEEVFKNYIRAVFGNNFYFRPNESKALTANLIRFVIASTRESCDVIYKNNSLLSEYEKTKEEIDKLRSWQRSIFTENAYGKLAHLLFEANVAAINLNSRMCFQEVILRSTQLIAALKAYKLDNGSIPNTLEELTPRYISELPKDPYSGIPFKYSAEKKIIYSIGMGLVDLGGSEEDSWRSMSNPTFKINF